MEQQNKQTKADKIRALTAQGMKPRDIAATVGGTLQSVYDVQYRDRMKTKKKELASSVRISPVTGKPVRKYKKRSVKKNRAKQAVPTPPKVQYIEVEVPQPHYNLTWGQRFKALFTGRV